MAEKVPGCRHALDVSRDDIGFTQCQNPAWGADAAEQLKAKDEEIERLNAELTKHTDRQVSPSRFYLEGELEKAEARVKELEAALAAEQQCAKNLEADLAAAELFG